MRATKRLAGMIVLTLWAAAPPAWAEQDTPVSHAAETAGTADTADADRADSNTSEAAPEPAAELPGVLVTAPREDESLQTTLTTRKADLDETDRALARDGAGLLTGVPGAAVNRNGPLTGIAQVRGLSGDRVKTLVDGMTITPACANHMDPPLHYVNPSTLESMRVVAGITPVSLGGDSLGGTLIAESEKPVFAEDEPFRITARANANYAGSQDAYGFAGTTGLASQRASLAYTGSYQTGDDLRIPGGTVSDTGFEIEPAWPPARGARRRARRVLARRRPRAHRLRRDPGSHDGHHERLEPPRRRALERQPRLRAARGARLLAPHRSRDGQLHAAAQRREYGESAVAVARDEPRHRLPARRDAAAARAAPRATGFRHEPRVLRFRRSRTSPRVRSRRESRAPTAAASASTPSGRRAGAIGGRR